MSDDTAASTSSRDVAPNAGTAISPPSNRGNANWPDDIVPVASVPAAVVSAANAPASGASDAAPADTTKFSATASATTAPVAITNDVVVRPPAAVLPDSDSNAYAALHDGAVFFDLGPRHISVFTGEKAADALNGLVTNDVMSLAVGQGLYAAALTPKGKMLADVSILRTEPHTYLVETSESAGREWWAMVRKYVNPRLAKYRDETATYATIGVYGPNASAIVARLGTGGLGDQTITNAMEEGLRAWPSWAHSSFSLSGVNVRLVRAPYLGPLRGFEILVPIQSRSDVIKNLARVGAVIGSSPLWQVAQIEGALPVYGLDMDANTIPQEANLDDWTAISYEKGCYTGQETVARLHFRGHVNKHLRGLSSPTLLQPGSPVHDLNGKAVGEVRRSAHSLRLGPIAIAMIRREIVEGAEVWIGPVGNAVAARVVALPFYTGSLAANAKRGAS